jgi:pimeloyl-ACP methyl ester carboxylesterase
MKEGTETRELLALDGHGAIVRGTYHKTYNSCADSPSNLIERDRVGVVFLNGLAATRASNGDVTVYWADSFAERGYPSFRLDLPGFGDSEGDPPPEWLNFINAGGYASIAAAKIKELVTRFNLSGVVIVGHCSGTVAAIHAAANRECLGLVLMDPSFHLSRSQTTRPKVRQKLNDWALQSRFGGFLSRIFDFLKQIRLLLRANALPENANFSLLRQWKEVASTGMPILILKAPRWRSPGTKPRVGEFDYLKHVLGLAGRKGRVVVKVMEGANHSFANRLGRVAVRQHTECWLNDNFPSLKREEGAVSTSLLERNGNKTHNQFHEDCTTNICHGV